MNKYWNWNGLRYSHWARKTYRLEARKNRGRDAVELADGAPHGHAADVKIGAAGEVLAAQASGPAAFLISFAF